jgi:hypothetical protein
VHTIIGLAAFYTCVSYDAIAVKVASFVRVLNGCQGEALHMQILLCVYCDIQYQTMVDDDVVLYWCMP